MFAFLQINETRRYSASEVQIHVHQDHCIDTVTYIIMIRLLIKTCKRFALNMMYILVLLMLCREATIYYIQVPNTPSREEMEHLNKKIDGHFNVVKIGPEQSLLGDTQEKPKTADKNIKRIGYSEPATYSESEVLMPRESLEEYPWQLMKYPRPTYVPKTRNPCFYVGTENTTDHELFCMPLVYLAGFTKSGSTDIFSKICTHQHITSGRWKEAQFWYHNTVRKHIGAQFYLNFRNFLNNYKAFTKAVINRCMNHKKEVKRNDLKCPFIAIDGSANYLFEAWFWERDERNPNPREPSFLAPHRIKHFIEHPKIIVLMRNPIERLFSDFKYFAGGKNGSTYFHTLVVNGIVWWENCTKTLSEYRCAYGRNYTGTGVPSLNPEGLCNWGDSDEFGHNGANRLRVSIYVLFIQKWLEVFPMDHFLFLTTEEYKKNPMTLLKQKIYPFLEVAPLSNKSEMALKSSLKFRKNVSKQTIKMLPETKELLENFYRPYNERLAKLLQEDKFMWLQH